MEYRCIAVVFDSDSPGISQIQSLILFRQPLDSEQIRFQLEFRRDFHQSRALRYYLHALRPYLVIPLRELTHHFRLRNRAAYSLPPYSHEGGTLCDVLLDFVIDAFLKEENRRSWGLSLYFSLPPAAFLLPHPHTMHPTHPNKNHQWNSLCNRGFSARYSGRCTSTSAVKPMPSEDRCNSYRNESNLFTMM